MAVLKKFNPDTQQWEILQGGVQGLQGPPVALAKGTVTTTAAGTNADFSITGTPPAQVLNLTLPRGEAGGWITTQIDSGTQDMNLLTTPGSYKDNNVTGAISRGYPEDGWQGIHEVVGVFGHTTQRTTRISSITTPEDSRTYMRVLRAGNWSPWRRVPLVGQVHLDIVGAGRPDIPASMTTEVAALVAAATSGAKFRSTDGPQGAWEWQKRGASWVCVEGDTGWCNMSAYLSDWVVPSGGFVQAKRTPTEVTWRFNVAPAESRYGAWNAAQGTFWANFLLGVPAAFWPPESHYVYERPMGLLQVDLQKLATLRYFTTGRASIYATLGSGTLGATSRVEGLLTWPVEAAWPTTI